MHVACVYKYFSGLCMMCPCQVDCTTFHCIFNNKNDGLDCSYVHILVRFYIIPHTCVSSINSKKCQVNVHVSYFWPFCSNQQRTHKHTHTHISFDSSVLRCYLYRVGPQNRNVSKMTTNIEIFEEFPLKF